MCVCCACDLAWMLLTHHKDMRTTHGSKHLALPFVLFSHRWSRLLCNRPSTNKLAPALVPPAHKRANSSHNSSSSHPHGQHHNHNKEEATERASIPCVTTLNRAGLGALTLCLWGEGTSGQVGRLCIISVSQACSAFLCLCVTSFTKCVLL